MGRLELAGRLGRGRSRSRSREGALSGLDDAFEARERRGLSSKGESIVLICIRGSRDVCPSKAAHLRQVSRPNCSAPFKRRRKCHCCPLVVESGDQVGSERALSKTRSLAAPRPGPLAATQSARGVRRRAGELPKGIELIVGQLVAFAVVVATFASEVLSWPIGSPRPVILTQLFALSAS